MTSWYRIMCDCHAPWTPVCDIESEGPGGPIWVYPHFAVMVPQLVDATDLTTRVLSRYKAHQEGKEPPVYHDGLVRTSYPDVARGEGFWMTCVVCESVRRKKFSARAKPDVLAWILDRIDAGLTTIDVELREEVAREGEADPSPPQWTSTRITMRLLPLARLQVELTNNPRGASGL